ncbi:MAG: hypothetical protein LBS77_04450 [Desulfovibrio sp.]|jgi:hypothetical protein|nr:hypothetical protein [Desulfovibrio sp.]
MNSYKQSFYIGLIRILANVFMFIAVFVGMYMASRGPWPVEAGFSIWFFGISVPVWTGAILLTRFVKKRFPAEEESLVDLPRRGLSLVRWRVLEPTNAVSALSVLRHDRSC